MRQVPVSTEVFALIWSLHQPGDANEDDILRRVLRTHSVRIPTSPADSDKRALTDQRNGVSFSEGFEIFRTYKGETFRARATRDGWELIDSGKLYKSLNAMNKEIVAGSENAWRAWSFKDDNGHIRQIGELRDRSNVARRLKRTPSAAGAKKEDGEMIWRDTVVEALRNLGGRAQLEAIYQEVDVIRTRLRLTRPRSLDAIVRRELENNSSDSLSFLGHHDLFYSVHGVGNGVWGLRSTD